MPPVQSREPFLEITNAVSKIDPGALMTLWANLPPHPPGVTADLFERFDDVDGDGDGFISRHELDRACSSRRFEGSHGAALAVLRRFLEDIQVMSHDEIAAEADGVTRADLVGLDLAGQIDPEHPIVANVGGHYRWAKQKLARSPRTVFHDDEAPTLDLFACRQGLMGDCFFLAPLFALVMQDPNRVLSMIRKHPEIPGAWRIYFRGAQDGITVASPTDAEIVLFASADGLWPIIFEKAYGVYLSGEPYSMLSTPIRAVGEPTLAGMHGGLVGKAMKALTGNEVDIDELEITRKSTTRAKLAEALDRLKVVVAVTPSDQGKKTWTGGGLVRSHAYSIVSFDAVSDTIYVRNPWGNDKGGLRGVETSEGFFKMPLDAFDANFMYVYYER